MSIAFSDKHLGLYKNFNRHKGRCMACSPRHARLLKLAKKRKRENDLETLNQGTP